MGKYSGGRKSRLTNATRFFSSVRGCSKHLKLGSVPILVHPAIKEICLAILRRLYCVYITDGRLNA